MIQALILLITAMQLLTIVASSPNLSQSFKDNAIIVANTAITLAQSEIEKAATTTEQVIVPIQNLGSITSQPIQAMPIQYQWSTNITKSRVLKLADGNTYLDFSMTPTYKVSKDSGVFNDGRDAIIITVAPNDGLGDSNGFTSQPIGNKSGLRQEWGFSVMKNGTYRLTFTAEGDTHIEDIVVTEL